MNLYKKKNTILIIIAGILLIGVMVFCAIKIGSYFKDAKKSETLYQSLSQATLLDPTKPETTEPDAMVENIISFQAQYEAAIALNDDVTGWVHIPNTQIDYPVLMGSDNIYYLKHNILGENSSHASIMMDNRTDKDSKNIVLYGHNMRDNTMFHDLMGYKKTDFYYTHPLVYLQTDNGCFSYRVFAVYIVTDVDKDIRTEFTDTDDFLSYISHAQSQALYQTDVAITVDDTILTLTTCTYETRDANLVVLAKHE